MKHILHTSWRKLADFFYEGPESEIPNHSCVIFAHTDQLVPLLKAMKKKHHNPLSTKYVLITADSDYGVVHQKDEPVWGDMNRWLKFCAMDEKAGYAPMVIPSRCQTENCKTTDDLSLKVYSWTKETFNYEDIPDNIHAWYATNFNVKDVAYRVGCMVTKIPFGVAPWMLPYIEGYQKQEKKDRLYVNFSFNTLERYDMWKALHFFEFCKLEEGVSHEQYAKSLSDCKAVLCLPGNGMDSYRILETLYFGSIPIVPLSGNWLTAYDGLPLGVYKSYDMNALLFSCRSAFTNFASPNLENTPADLDYWKKKIEQSKMEAKSL